LKKFFQNFWVSGWTLPKLWHGRTDEALDYLKNQIEAKNEEKLQELITYLEKHFEPIIDYDRRKKAGKTVDLEPAQEEDEVVKNQQSSNTKTVESDDVSMPCDIIRKPQKPKKANLNQEQEDVKAKNQSSSKGKVTKKAVGSVRFEKACDNTIGKRQKRKAMSWSKVGSRSLGACRT